MTWDESSFQKGQPAFIGNSFFKVAEHSVIPCFTTHPCVFISIKKVVKLIKILSPELADFSDFYQLLLYHFQEESNQLFLKLIHNLKNTVNILFSMFLRPLTNINDTLQMP